MLTLNMQRQFLKSKVKKATHGYNDSVIVWDHITELMDSMSHGASIPKQNTSMY